MIISDSVECLEHMQSNDMLYQNQKSTMSANRGIFVNLCMFRDSADLDLDQTLGGMI